MEYSLWKGERNELTRGIHIAEEEEQISVGQAEPNRPLDGRVYAR